MVTELTKGLYEKYELLKKRYKDVFQDSTMSPQIRVKSLKDINDKSSSSNADLGRNINELLSEIALADNAKDLLKGQYSRVQDYYRYVQYYTKEQIFNKAIELKGSINLDIYLVIALMNKANKIATGYELRPVQILSTLEFFRENGALNKFCQVNTGEGKTTLTSLIAVIKALQGETVDIITSNEVLAQDAVRDREDFYSLFGLSVAHNNADHSHEKGTRDCYKHDIVYGTIGNFEFDYLKDRIKLSEAKGSRGFGSLIIDEADNVVLDNAAHVAKISGPIAGMEYLQYVYLNIWQALIKVEQILGLQDIEIDQVTIEDKRLIQEVMSICVKANINNSLIPKFLESYVDRKLDAWISNAVHARYDYYQYQHYLIGKKDTERSDISAEENVIPLLDI
ncbi:MULTISPECIES: DEAD/DEAH box helicase [unclassified Rickettsia]|uniref:DEAD/DEAH box helicase n=1 Tax=unclassified Rickettsia TaxID=114295 RepID=UPI00313349A9